LLDECDIIRDMRKIFLFLISLSVGLGIFVWILKMVGWGEIKNAIGMFTGWQGLIILGLTLLMIVAGSYKWKEILNGEGVRLPFWKIFRLYLAGFSLMFLAPIIFLSGEIFRIYHLKEMDSVSVSKAASSVIIDRILEWTMNLTIIIFGTLFFLLMIGVLPRNLLIIFGTLFIFFFTLLLFFYLKIFKKESIIKGILNRFWFKKLKQNNSILETEKEIFNFFRIGNKSMWKGFFFSFLRMIITYLRTLLLILFLGKNISFLSVFSVLGFSYLAAMVPIPSALGSHEAIQIFGFTTLGLGPSTATAFTMIVRGAELVTAIFGLIILFKLGIGLLKNILFKKLNNIFDKISNGQSYQ